MKIPALLDSFLALFSPHRRERTVRYKAAEYSRLVGQWFPGNIDQNELIARSNPLLRARVRDLVRNFPPFAKAVDSMSAFVVGKGSRFQSLATDEKGRPSSRLRQKIEDRFKAWMDEADVARRLHFYEIQQLAVRQEMECGEFLLRFVRPRGRGRTPFALQLHEPEELNSPEVTGQAADTRIFQGVEYDIWTGEVLAYHFQSALDLAAGFKTWREPAENCIHLYQTLRPGQLRGVTPFAPAILLAKDMSDYIQAEIDSAKLAAKILGFVKTSDIAGFQNSRGVGRVGNRPERQDIEDLENAVIEYMRPGEDMIIAPGSGRGNEGFMNFNRLMLRMLSVAGGLPYEVISGDYTDINYTTSKAIRNDLAQTLHPRKFRLEQHLVRRVFNRWLDFEALTQNYLPGYFKDPSFYRRAMWIPAAQPSVDPLRDGKADIDAISAGIRAPQSSILSRGEDPAEVLALRKSWKDDCEALGLDPGAGGVDTSLANNPAKLGVNEQGETQATVKPSAKRPEES